MLASNIPVMKRDERPDILKKHPCFSKEAHHKFGRIHLPVAPACNIQCRYCIRKYDCANESRPGITSTVLTPGDALERIGILIDGSKNISVIGIAGPGDPLANEATFEVLGAINREFPEIILCVSTNGLLLPEKLGDLLRSGVRSLTITMNAVSLDIAEKIYAWITCNGITYKGWEAAEYLLLNQQIGLRNAVEAGLAVKVNTVFIPGVNDTDIPSIAALAGRRGAHIMNIIPLIPQADFADLQRPSHEMINKMRRECGKYILQMTHCRQCRADAFGILGEDGDMELAVLNSRIGEDYCDNVQ